MSIHALIIVGNDTFPTLMRGPAAGWVGVGSAGQTRTMAVKVSESFDCGLLDVGDGHRVYWN